MQTKTNPRPYRSGDHLRTIIESDAGRISVLPVEADRIVFDAASSNSMPANLPDSDYNGSSVLDIGRGVQARVSGSVQRTPDGWTVTHLYGHQYPAYGRELTGPQRARTSEIVGEMVTDWAATHEGDIAQADDINRNNAARTLEEQIIRHEEALEILRDSLSACEEGEPFTQYPELPTKR